MSSRSLDLSHCVPRVAGLGDPLGAGSPDYLTQPLQMGLSLGVSDMAFDGLHCPLAKCRTKAMAQSASSIVIIGAAGSWPTATMSASFSAISPIRAKNGGKGRSRSRPQFAGKLPAQCLEPRACLVGHWHRGQHYSGLRARGGARQIAALLPGTGR